MGILSKRKRPVDRKISFRDARLIVIATEGRLTERQYFEIFSSSRIQVYVCETQADGRSSPEYVLSRLDEFKKQYQSYPDDEFWLIVDFDRWKSKKLSEVASKAHDKGYDLAVSNPCFECWLFLHYDDIKETQLTSGAMTKKLKEKLGAYNKAKLDVSKFKGREKDAVKRAKELDTHPGNRWPLKTGTHVYKVVEKIIKALS